MTVKKLIQALLIEDDPFFAVVFSDLGKKMGSIELAVHHTVSLEESLSFLEEHHETELILLDYRVHHQITGLEILQHIRAKGVNVPVIVVTASGSEEIAASMMKAGASDYLVKGNISLEVLERSIKDALERHQMQGKVVDTGEESILKDLALKRSLNGVSVMDLKGYITYVNPSFVTMYGYGSEEEIVGRNMKELLPAPGKFDEVLAVLGDKKVWLGELAGLKKDKVEISMQTLFSLIEYKALKSTEIMASFIDITKLKDAEKKRESLYRGIMEVFALKAEEVGNVETAGHIRRIAEYTRFIAEELRKQEPFKNYIDDKYVSDISYASMLHDVGKWRTPNEILLKPDQLTEAEWVIIKQHPKLGVDMLMPLLKDKGSNQYLKLVESVVLYHHERWDGSGYPEGLKGEEIPLSARIVALADTYDALVSDRSYRKGYSHEQAVEIIRKEERRLDPRVWQIFMDNHSKFKKLKDKSSSLY